jgi:superfamily I DNA/RNA helicase
MVNWSKEKQSLATFKRYANDGRTLKIYIHEQDEPIKCTAGHRQDFHQAVSVAAQLTDGQAIRYHSRGIDTYSPKEWFYRIELLGDNSEVSKVSEPVFKSPPTETIPPFSESEKTSQKVYGPPGTGKTTTMMNIIRKRLSEGVKPEEICFVSFTNVAANEAIERVSREFDEYQMEDFPYFKTIHALATALGGLDGKQIMTHRDMERFDKTILSTPVWTEKGKAESIKIRSEHPCLTLKSLASARKTNIKQQIPELSKELDFSKSVERSIEENKWFAPTFDSTEAAVNFWLRSYERYKEAHNFVDYDDVIKKVLSDEFDKSLLRFKLLIIDEAQDNSDFMWDFLKLMIAECKEVYICGDDDQAIMDGFGANSQAFLEIETTDDDLVLSKSWRLPAAHHQNLLQQDGALSVLKLFKKHRKEKVFTHNGDLTGVVATQFEVSESEYEDITLEKIARLIQIDPKQDWLLMAPTRATVDAISIALLNKGISHYKSNEPQYVGDGISVFDIRVQTIHTSKGAEADNVAVFINSMGDIGMYSDQNSPFFNPTLRYVAESRAKKNLYLSARI